MMIAMAVENPMTAHPRVDDGCAGAPRSPRGQLSRVSTRIPALTTCAATHHVHQNCKRRAVMTIRQTDAAIPIVATDIGAAYHHRPARLGTPTNRNHAVSEPK